MIEDATRSQQAGYDRRINVLNTQLEAERARAADAVRAHEVQLRELALSKDGLTPEDKQRLQEQWSVEDEKAKLAAWQQELEGFHGQLTVASLVEEFGAYGVKPEDLTDYDTPEEMEAHCLEAKANALEARLAAGVTAPPAQPAPAAPVAPAPAGVTQTSDVGGGGGAPHVPAEMNAEPGRDNLAANIAASGWSTVKLPY